MQRKISITMSVNSEKHAEEIRQELIKALEMRTTIFFIGDMENINVKETVDLLHQKRIKQSMKFSK